MEEIKGRGSLGVEWDLKTDRPLKTKKVSAKVGQAMCDLWWTAVWLRGWTLFRIGSATLGVDLLRM